MAEPVKICIVVQGGVVSAVLSMGVPVEFATVDYDVDGADPADVRQVPQSGGWLSPAVITVEMAEMDEKARGFAMQAFELAARSAESDGCRTCAEATETRLLPCDECGAMDESEAANG